MKATSNNQPTPTPRKTPIWVEAIAFYALLISLYMVWVIACAMQGPLLGQGA